MKEVMPMEKSWNVGQVAVRLRRTKKEVLSWTV